MKIYLAASYPRKKEIAGIASSIEDIGHEVIGKWFEMNEGYDTDDRDETEEEMECRMGSAALRDMIAVEECDLLICFTDGEKQLTHGGRHSELGIALGHRKQIILVGPRESVFHYSNCIVCRDNVEDLILDLEETLHDAEGLIDYMNGN